MKRLAKLIRSIILGASSSLALGSGANANESLQANSAPTPHPDNHNLISNDKQKRQLVFKKTRGTDLLNFAFHGSHGSHSSHSSHASHASSSGSYGTPSTTTPVVPNQYEQSNVTVAVDSTLGWRLLKKGMSGPDVRQLKDLLVTVGYKLKPDEYFDEETDAMVRDFQAKHYVDDKGVVGPLTIFYLKKASQ